MPEIRAWLPHSVSPCFLKVCSSESMCGHDLRESLLFAAVSYRHRLPRALAARLLRLISRLSMSSDSEGMTNHHEAVRHAGIGQSKRNVVVFNSEGSFCSWWDDIADYWLSQFQHCLIFHALSQNVFASNPAWHHQWACNAAYDKCSQAWRRLIDCSCGVFVQVQANQMIVQLYWSPSTPSQVFVGEVVDSSGL